MREFIGINDRLSRACPASGASALGTFLPKVGAFRRQPPESKITIVQRSHIKDHCTKSRTRCVLSDMPWTDLNTCNHFMLIIFMYQHKIRLNNGHIATSIGETILIKASESIA